MASAADEDIKVDLTICSICLETLNVPKHFPCLHSFCEKCVDTYITKTLANVKIKDGVNCPVCREFVKKPEDVTVEDWSKNLPINHILVSLIDIKEPNCSPRICAACARENKTESAQSWCINCAEALCAVCTRCHRTNKLSGFHRIVDISEIEDKVPPIQNADILCTEHPDKRLEAYCADHSVVCCMSCVMLKHRKCDNVGSVEDAAQSQRGADETKTLEKSLSDIRKELVFMMQGRDENLRIFDRSIDAVNTDIETLIREISQNLQQLKTKALTQVAAVTKEIRPKLEQEKEELQCKISAVDNNLALFKSIVKYAPPAQFLDTMRRLSEQSSVLRKNLDQKKFDMKDVFVTYETNSKLSEMKTEIQSLGEIEILRCNLVLGSRFHAPVVDMSSKTPTLVTSKDVTYLIKGIYMLNDGNILLYNQPNREIELWDSQCTLLSSLSVPNYPWRLKMICNTESALAVNSDGLLRYKIDNGNIINRYTSVPMYLDFIYHQKRYFIGTTNRIIVHDSSHRHLCYIAVSGVVEYMAARDNSTLCYTLWDGCKLYCITLDGAPVFTYTHDKLQGTACITVDNARYIYVCGYVSKNVHQLSHDGKLQRIILDDLPAHPCCISFNGRGDKVVVGCRNKLLMYNLI